MRSRITRATDIKGRARRQRKGIKVTDLQELRGESAVDTDVLMYDSDAGDWNITQRGEIRICMVALAKPLTFV